ncbi:uncharacterized protein LOC100908120 [Galendromus occidentalis]|uniref:Uncharacterized protein LOC100908120 n=1 Tax=Galendromus occidentalis TaxID=34638 RepID=A0AAJ6QQT2_9ACAR|nr:uncharacterized protein LOC100908120 [Galendromus occidentalis]
MDVQRGAGSLKSAEMPEGSGMLSLDIELIDDDYSISSCSTSETGMSNSFLDEAITGLYDRWTIKMNEWLGRWATDTSMRNFLYYMQEFRFLDMQSFPSADPQGSGVVEEFMKGVHHVDDFLRSAELDIVNVDRRFPEGVYHFIDGQNWVRTFNDIYTALQYAQDPSMLPSRFLELWKSAINTALCLNLPDGMTRKKFEQLNKVIWADPKLESINTISCESDLKEANVEPHGISPEKDSDSKFGILGRDASSW